MPFKSSSNELKQEVLTWKVFVHTETQNDAVWQDLQVAYKII